ncbi:hypothetical protein C8J56DRAFT_1166999 [Mycena floridula]|nr:hypothetical protein C8J56DRAFT_1166999 [Mycena floridula]
MSAVEDLYAELPSDTGIKPHSKHAFKLEQEAWIAGQYPQLAKRFGFNMTPPSLTNMPGFKEWKSRKHQQMLARFGNKLPDCWSDKLVQKWTNFRKAEAGRASQANGAAKAPALPAFLLVDTESSTTGFQLFQKDRKPDISAQATNQRVAANQNSKQHVGLMKKLTSAEWKSLTPEKREEWVAQAKATAAQRAQEVGTSIYRNQQILLAYLNELLALSVGKEKGQIGDAVFHVMYGMRNETDTLDCGSLEISAGGIPSFSSFVKGYDKDVKVKWHNYCGTHLAFNIEVQYDDVLARNDHGLFLLDVFDEENMALKDYRSQLKLFLEASWNDSWPRCADMPALPWTQITMAPAKYFSEGLSLDETALSAFADMDKASLLNFAAAISVFQTSFPDHCIFCAKADIEAEWSLTAPPADIEEVLPENQQGIELHPLSRPPSLVNPKQLKFQPPSRPMSPAISTKATSPVFSRAASPVASKRSSALPPSRSPSPAVSNKSISSSRSHAGSPTWSKSSSSQPPSRSPSPVVNAVLSGACQRCRSRKVKCRDGNPCATCATAGVQCVRTLMTTNKPARRAKKTVAVAAPIVPLPPAVQRSTRSKPEEQVEQVTRKSNRKRPSDDLEPAESTTRKHVKRA